MQASIYHPRYESLRAALVGARKRAGLTQTQMAQRLGVGQSFVSKIERGDSYVEVFTCVDWCTACGITPGALLDALAPPQPLPIDRAECSAADMLKI